MASFSGQASRAKMMSLGGKLTALVCHSALKVNKAEELTYLSTNIETSPTQNLSSLGVNVGHEVSVKKGIILI
jgi:hypothetical protein